MKGGAKFFDGNYSLLKEGAQASASSNNSSIKFILDTNNYTIWESLGSSDSIFEKIVIDLPLPRKIDSLFLVRMNFKEFKIKYHDGISFVDFEKIETVNGEKRSSIDEHDYGYNTAYYKFTEVFTNRIEITCNKTQIENAQKVLSSVILTKELGTFQGFPRIRPSSNNNETRTRTLSKKSIVQKTYETNRIEINFKSHSFQNDLTLIETLFQREKPFLIYPCGARVGEKYFKLEQKNWRLEDLYNMQTVGELKNEYEKGVYLLGFNKTIKLVEHI